MSNLEEAAAEEEMNMEEATMPKSITFLSALLNRVTESNDLNYQFQAQQMSIFNGLTRPTISIQSYLERIFKYANCSPCCYVVAYVYLDRFAQTHPSFLINSFNVHRLLVTSIVLAVKFMDDIYYNNAYYAKVGGISTREMNLLEMDMLFGLRFDLNVTPNTFQTYSLFLEREMLKQAPLCLLLNPPLPLHQHKHQEQRYFDKDESSHQKQLTV